MREGKPDVGLAELLGENVEALNQTAGPLPERLPVLPVRGTVLFPGVVLPLLVGREASVRLVERVLDGDRLLAVAAQRDEAAEEPDGDDIHAVGTAARILKALQLPNGKLNVIVQGLQRARLSDWQGPAPFLTAHAVPLRGAAPAADDEVEIEALTVSTQRLLQRLLEVGSGLPSELATIAEAMSDANGLADIVSAHLNLPVVDKQELLELLDPTERLRRLVPHLTRQVQIFELSQKIETEVQDEIDKSQREFYLRERLKAIRRELGEDDDGAAEVEELATRIEEAEMPEEVDKAARQELDRLARMSPAAAEYNVVRTYLDWLLDIPWSVRTDDNLDLGVASDILDEDHYDLEKIKKRIVEYLAVRKLKPDMKGPILCLVGPPGVGKTSLGRSIARALGRQFIRVSLGGIHDEAEIRGHRRTYVGALPGRIVQGLKKAGSMNPVFMLDEIDKIGTDFRGDPSSALLEVLDPEQNHAFSDHYLEVPIDLSRVLFIATGNVPEQIPEPLYDRMEILELPGYTAEEKVFIAQNYLMPRQRRDHGLGDDQITFIDEAIAAIVGDYTEEAGVRELERQIAAICRAVARRVAETIDGGGRTEPVEVTAADLHGFLGPVRYFSEVAEHTAAPGVATGLAWTPSGGDILFVEATCMKGKGELSLTGQLGEVMKESAQAALSYLRSKASELGLKDVDFDRYDVHVHVPAGAVPKDGPSAGIAMLVALASLFTGRRVHADLGVTGEITLRGMVLPVGGIKNKVLAARRAGLQRVLLPEKNEKDLEEVPEQARQGLEFVFVKRMEEALEIALEPAAAAGKGAGRRRRETRRRKPATRRKSATPPPGPDS